MLLTRKKRPSLNTKRLHSSKTVYLIMYIFLFPFLWFPPWHFILMYFTPFLCNIASLKITYFDNGDMLLTKSHVFISLLFISIKSHLRLFFPAPLQLMMNCSSFSIYPRPSGLFPSYCWILTLALSNCLEIWLQLTARDHQNFKRFKSADSLSVHLQVLAVFMNYCMHKQ